MAMLEDYQLSFGYGDGDEVEVFACFHHIAIRPHPYVVLSSTLKITRYYESMILLLTAESANLHPTRDVTPSRIMPVFTRSFSVPGGHPPRGARLGRPNVFWTVQFCLGKF